MKQVRNIDPVIYKESNYQQHTSNIGPTRETRRHPKKETSTLYTKKHTLGRYSEKNLENYKQ